MAWIELHSPLIRHRKLKKFARELNIKPVQAVGHLTTLWANVLELAEDGNITKWTIDDIAEYCNWEGDPKKFYKALVNDKDGWIDERNGKRFIHDWLDYAGRYLKAKYHTYNPERLTEILGFYGKVTLSQPKGDLKATFSQTLGDQPTNQSIYLSINKLLTKFYTSYKQKTTNDYLREPNKDKAIFKMLLKTIKEGELENLIGRFFELDTPFVKQTGYTINIFKSQINQLRSAKEEGSVWKKKI